MTSLCKHAYFGPSGNKNQDIPSGIYKGGNGNLFWAKPLR